jgi:multidrug efflux pump
MLGETTLAMLYVPLFFYIFDRLKERSEPQPPQAAPHAETAATDAAPLAPKAEGD